MWQSRNRSPTRPTWVQGPDLGMTLTHSLIMQLHADHVDLDHRNSDVQQSGRLSRSFCISSGQGSPATASGPASSTASIGIAGSADFRAMVVRSERKPHLFLSATLQLSKHSEADFHSSRHSEADFYPLEHSEADFYPLQHSGSRHFYSLKHTEGNFYHSTDSVSIYHPSSCAFSYLVVSVALTKLLDHERHVAG